MSVSGTKSSKILKEKKPADSYYLLYCSYPAVRHETSERLNIQAVVLYLSESAEKGVYHGN